MPYILPRDLERPSQSPFELKAGSCSGIRAGLKYYLSKYGLDVKYINIKCYNDRKYIVTRRPYSNVVNAYYDDLINGVECNDLMYLNPQL